MSGKCEALMDTRDADCARGLVSDIDRQLIVGAGPPDIGFEVVFMNCRDLGLVSVCISARKGAISACNWAW